MKKETDIKRPTGLQQWHERIMENFECVVSFRVEPQLSQIFAITKVKWRDKGQLPGEPFGQKGNTQGSKRF